MANAAISGVVHPDMLSDTSASFRQLFACPISGSPRISRRLATHRSHHDDGTVPAGRKVQEFNSYR